MYHFDHPTLNFQIFEKNLNFVILSVPLEVKMCLIHESKLGAAHTLYVGSEGKIL